MSSSSHEPVSGQALSSSVSAPESSSAPAAPHRLEYAYTHSETRATTGYFSCEPPEELRLEQKLALLEARPLDDFLHQHVLRVLSREEPEALAALAATAYDASADAFPRPALASVLLECSILVDAHSQVCASFPEQAARRLAPFSPTVYLRAVQQPDWQQAAGWNELFQQNICEHHALPRPEEADFPLLFSSEAIEAEQARMREKSTLLEQAYATLKDRPWQSVERPPAKETFFTAINNLMEAGLIAGPEMRHEASLSPIALLRSWQVDISVDNGSLHHSLQGQATAYGRGLMLAQARASYSMEILERASAYVSVGAVNGSGAGEGAVPVVGQILQRRQPMPLYRARYAELLAEGRAVLDPATLPLEAPLPDVPLHWVQARDVQGRDVLVPAQAVFLFCNLDEPNLYLAGGSTGLASGNTVEEARQAALTEIMERDAEASTPFNRAQCFTLRSRDERIQSLLDDYRARGIRVQFQDLTTELGLPVYQCFVTAHDGRVARATGANLSGPRAALAALTETPWPYVWAQPAPFGKASGPGLAGLPERVLEDLPDYSLPSAAANVQLLETMLAGHGKSPLYVDMTREDLELPVVRALVPGLELNAEWDRFSRPSLRLFARYVRQFRE